MNQDGTLGCEEGGRSASTYEMEWKHTDGDHGGRRSEVGEAENDEPHLPTAIEANYTDNESNGNAKESSEESKVQSD